MVVVVVIMKLVVVMVVLTKPHPSSSKRNFPFREEDYHSMKVILDIQKASVPYHKRLA